MDSKMLRSITAVQQGKIAVETIAKRRLQLIEKENSRVNAIVEHHSDELLAQAREIDEWIKEDKNLYLAGAVITVKDGLAVEGMRSTAGLLEYKDNFADRDCDVVRKLRNNGALILGKTNMSAGALDVQTDNPVYGRTNHPFFTDRTCGGSSGGGACSVALGFSDIDIGYDLMGSIRIPAHFCGIYGFIPTSGAIFVDGMTGGKPMGSTLGKMLRIGIQTSDIKNIQYLLPALFRSSFPVKSPERIGKLRIGWSEDCGGIPLSEDSKVCFRAFREKLSTQYELSHITQEDYAFEAARLSFLTLLYGAISAYLPKTLYLITRYLLKNKLMNNQLRNFLDAENEREALIRQMEALFKAIDCLVVPVSATPAFRHKKPDRMNGLQPIYDSFDVDGIDVNYATANLGFTTPFLTGNPVVSMPIGKTRAGLPVGVQVIGGFYEDEKLLEIVRTLEHVL